MTRRGGRIADCPGVDASGTSVLFVFGPLRGVLYFQTI